MASPNQIEKSLTAQVLSEQDAPADDESTVKVGVLNPEAVMIETEDGGVEFNFGEDEEKADSENLAEMMDDDDLSELASDLIANYEDDRSSRQEWEDTYTEGLELLGIRNEVRTMPFDGATGVNHPILSEAVIRFVSQSIMEIFPASGPVKTKVAGEYTDEKGDQARRVENYMNHLLTEEMPEYRTETEQLLFQLSLAGSAFRKVYFDPYLKRPASVFVPAEDFVISYSTSDLTSSPRHTHVMQKTDNFVRKMQINGFYKDFDLAEATGGAEGDVQTKYDDLTGVTEVSETDLRTILEIHAELELKGFEDKNEKGEDTGVALPYIVTIDKDSNSILSIRRNYKENDPLKTPTQFFVHYKFQPGLGYYGFGLIHLIGSIAKSSTSILRQLIDAGTLANLPAGFKARGLRIKGDDTPIAPGEFRDLDLPSGAIRDNIMPLPFKEPSQTLANLLGVLVQEGRRFASIADLQIGEGNQEAPVGTTLALIERSMKVMSAIHARLHSSLRRELSLLSDVIASSIEEYPYDEKGNPQEDFDKKVDIIPVSDPNATSFAQRMMQQQTAMQIAGSAPQMYDMRELHKRFLETAGIQEIDKILPDKGEIPAYDPVSENARMLAGGGVKAYSYQEHDSHISAHMSLMQNPALAQNPNAKLIQQIVSSHISEHMAHKYRNEAEQLMQTQLPPLDIEDGKGLPEEEEQKISTAAAQAAAQITGKAQQQAVLEQQMAAAQDPVVQQQQAELQLKQAELQQEAAEAQLEAQTDIQKTKMRNDLEFARLQQQKQIADDKLRLEVLKARKGG
tara:strand:+ start:3491 stop:5875 length:2385 start_codon:yes stop_codon:yes gene_type:complete